MQWLRAFDESAFRLVHESLHMDALDPVFWLLSTSGLGYVQVLALLVAAASIGRGLGVREALRRNLRTWGWPLLLSFAISGAINTLLIKQVVGRERPSNFVWARPQESAFFDGFPSGHTSTSFGIAVMAVFLTRGTRYAWAGWVGLLWATLVGFSRIYRGVHWPTDVLGGALAGVLGACLAMMWWNRITSDTNDRSDHHSDT